VVPAVEESDMLQGFPRGWTAPAEEVALRKGSRWKLTGNAVTVGVSTWLGSRLRNPGEPILDGSPVHPAGRWPTAAFGAKGKVWAVDVSMWPILEPYEHLRDVVDLDGAQPLSARGAAGFLDRANRGNLRFVEGFLKDVEQHVAFMSEALPVA
jgi:DNA (cytosine-5)-methyltransferase 1